MTCPGLPSIPARRRAALAFRASRSVKSSPVQPSAVQPWMSVTSSVHPGRSIPAQRDDVPALKPEHPPGERVSHAAVLPGQPLAQVILELPGPRVRQGPSRLRLRGTRLRRLPGPHPLDGPPECLPVGLHLQEARQELLLELVTVLHVGACAKRADQLRKQRLGSHMPRVLERLLGKGQSIRELHPTSVTSTGGESNELQDRRSVVARWFFIRR
jgi:hypothetical protein